MPETSELVEKLRKELKTMDTSTTKGRAEHNRISTAIEVIEEVDNEIACGIRKPPQE